MKNNKIPLTISQDELTILKDMVEIGYGELYDINDTEGSVVASSPLWERQFNFVKLLREHKHFDKVVIFDAEPTVAEAKGVTTNRRKCLVKVKF